MCGSETPAPFACKAHIYDRGLHAGAKLTVVFESVRQWLTADRLQVPRTCQAYGTRGISAGDNCQADKQTEQGASQHGALILMFSDHL